MSDVPPAIEVQPAEPGEAPGRLEGLIRRQRLLNRALRFVAAPFMLGLAAVFLVTLALRNLHLLPAATDGTFALLWAGIMAVYGGTALWLIRAWSRCVRTLADTGDLRSLGSVVSVLSIYPGPMQGSRRQTPIRDTQAVACSALVRLLPRLQAEDAGLLTGGQRRLLYEMLDCTAPREREDPVLNAAILRGFAQIGDRRELPLITSIASGRDCTNGSPHAPAVQQAARGALEAITLRLEAERARAELLRPSAAHTDDLLRPAAGQHASEKEELLRAAVDSGENPA